jgi:tetratricopeptide (TPR) repeat protein
MTLNLVIGTRVTDDNEPLVQEQLYAAVRATRSIDPKWISTDVLQVIMQAFEMMAQMNEDNGDYRAQSDDLLRLIEVADALYARTSNAQLLLQKSRAEFTLADAYFYSDQDDKFLPMIAQSRQTVDEFLQLKPRSQNGRDQRAETFIGAGEYYMYIGDFKKALGEFDVAFEIGSSNDMTNSRINRGICFAYEGMHAIASEEMDRLSAQRTLDAEGLFEVSRVYALCATAAGNDLSLDQSEQAARTATYGEQSLALLVRCMNLAGESAKAYWQEARDDSDFATLHENPRFRELENASDAES